MTANTKIEWADHTFNPWIGCTKVGPGCDHCYAEADFDKRRHVVTWGAGQPRKRTAPSTWAQPLRWNAEAGRDLKAWEQFKAVNGVDDAHLIARGMVKPARPRVFCASLADVFDNEVPTKWRGELWALINKTPHLDWLLLTKRIGNVKTMMYDPEDPQPNVWIGATICNQEEADRDIPKLLAVPAATRFLSMEPLLGPVELGLCNCDHGSVAGPGGVGGATCYKCNGHGGRRLDWIIVGGESGPNARPMHPDAARSLRDQCQAAGVPFFFKQWGEWVPYEDSAQPPFLWSQHGHEIDGHVLPDFESEDGQRQSEWHRDWSDMLLARRVGKKAAGRLLDGREWSEVPAC